MPNKCCNFSVGSIHCCRVFSLSSFIHFHLQFFICFNANTFYFWLCRVKGIDNYNCYCCCCCSGFVLRLVMHSFVCIVQMYTHGRTAQCSKNVCAKDTHTDNCMGRERDKWKWIKTSRRNLCNHSECTSTEYNQAARSFALSYSPMTLQTAWSKFNWQRRWKRIHFCVQNHYSAVFKFIYGATSYLPNKTWKRRKKNSSSRKTTTTK